MGLEVGAGANGISPSPHLLMWSGARDVSMKILLSVCQAVRADRRPSAPKHT